MKNNILKFAVATIAILIISLFGHAESKTQTKETGKLYQQLIELNSNWSQYSPQFTQLINLELPQSDEVSLIQTHLQLVIAHLESSDVTHLTARQQSQRQIHIRTLREYSQRGQFPKNVVVEKRCPVFIDPMGTHCAVGFLIDTSGRADLADAINQQHHLDFLRDIKTPGLEQWQKDSGLSLAELELIQPTYQFMNKGVLSYPKEIEDLILGDSSSLKAAMLADESLLTARCGGKQLVHFAAAAGDLEFIKWLVSNGADLKALSKIDAEKTTKTTRNGMGIVKTCIVYWNKPTSFHGAYENRIEGRSVSKPRGEAVVSVLNDLAGGDEGKNALYFATAEPKPLIKTVSRGAQKINSKESIEKALAQLNESRKLVAEWLVAQGLK